MAEFFYSPAARRDLLEIWEFIAQDDLDKADRVERESEQAITKLADDPKLGHLRRDLTTKPIRFWSVYSTLPFTILPLDRWRSFGFSADIGMSRRC